MRQRGRRGLVGKLEPRLGADPPAVLQVSASPRPRCCPAALCGPRISPPGSRRRSPAGLLSWPCGAGTGSQLPGARAVRGNGPGRASPLAPGFAARPSLLPPPPRRWDAAGGAPRYRERSPAGGGSHSAGPAGGVRSGKSARLLGPVGAARHPRGCRSRRSRNPARRSGAPCRSLFLLEPLCAA